MINNVLFKPLLLFLIVLCFVGCHHEEACFLGRVEQKENNNYFVRVVEAPEDFSRIGPPSLLIFPEGNLSGIFEEGDEISFVIKKYEEVRPDGFSTGWPPTYRCTVKPCK